MGSWDELCLVCGVCPGGGPYSLLTRYQLEDKAREIASELEEGNEELVAIVRDALAASFSDEEGTLGFRYDWLPEGMGSVSVEDHHYATGTCIAVGYFTDIGLAPFHDSKLPDGCNVQIRQVTQDSGGSFGALVCTQGPRTETLDFWPTDCSTTEDINCNFAVHDRCYYYLKNWINHAGLPSPNNGRSLSFAGELYELLNSRTNPRDSDHSLFPGVDYAGIEASLDQWQSFFTPCRKGVKYIRRAIQEGIRGKDLIPAILRDCRAWMFMRPDIWPSPSLGDVGLTFSPVSPPSAQAPTICNLPNEIILPILHDLPIVDLLSLSAACRSLHQLITDPPFLNRILQEALLQGSCRYILPVHGLREEEKCAFEAIRLWLPESVRPPSLVDNQESEDEENPEMEDEAAETEGQEAEEEDEPAEVERTIPPIKPLILDPQFPALAFIRACQESDSMRNRQRLYGLVKQIEEEWKSYRLNGWKVDRFFPSEEILDKLHKDPKECRPLCER
ncbi:hypothetical protein BDY19DRAFT_997400 [Irpex rosettiformis]|uniref:Uncharacterized protein n=1 Tax=Irpex rosettiformis TaxID=378272 RepID=A0ACB8TRZ5_9APHY|nr:hypothetical protein BDY19DRAFT_997400 [Irpex rosettiformis]